MDRTARYTEFLVGKSPIDSSEPLLFLVHHGGLRNVHRTLGPLRHLSERRRKLLQESLVTGSMIIPSDLGTPIRICRGTSTPSSAPEPKILSYQEQRATAKSALIRQNLVLPLAVRIFNPAMMAVRDGRWLSMLALQLSLPGFSAAYPERMDSLTARAVFEQVEHSITLDPKAIALLMLQAEGLPEVSASYRIEKYLGTGRWTVSFVARHVNTLVGPQVVLKFLRPPARAFSNIAILQAEQQLRPNDSLMVCGEHVFWVVRYLPWGNLSDVVTRHSEPERTAMIVRSVIDICEALALVHERGAAHGGISHTNILFDGQKFLLDFPSAGSLSAQLPGETTKQRDIQDLVTTLKRLATEGLFTPPEWLTELIERCTSEPPQLLPSIHDILREYVLPYADPSREQTVILSAGRDYRSNRIHYDLDLGGQKVVELLSHNAGNALLGDLCSLWDEIGDIRENPAELPALVQEKIEKILTLLGRSTQDVLGPKLLARLSESLPLPLWLIYDPEVAAIPWELLTVKGHPLCQWVPMTRSPRLFAENGLPKVAGPRTLSLHPRAAKIRVLLIADLAGDLPIAKQECERIYQELEHCCLHDRLEVKMITATASLLELRAEMRQCDVIHFASHAEFCLENPAESALILARGDRLYAKDLGGFWNEGTAPLLFFASSCYSARSPWANCAAYLSNVTMGLAHSFLAAGVGSYLGTIWKIPDNSQSADFAVTFYRRFFAGYTAARAVLSARRESQAPGSQDLTWARYTLFGHPHNRIDLLQR